MPTPTLLTPPPTPPEPGQTDQPESESDRQALTWAEKIKPLVAPAKTRSGRFAGLEEHELITLIDSLDDERARARFRESIYISTFVCIAIAWFLLYGPRVLFHQPRVKDPFAAISEHEKELTRLDDPHLTQPKAAAARDAKQKNNAAKQAAPQNLDQKTIERLREMSRQRRPQPQAAPQQKPPEPQNLPPAPVPQQTAAVTNPPLPQRPAALPDNPRPAPAPTRPDFSTNSSAGNAVQQAARDSGHGSLSGGDFSPSPGRGHGDVGTGVDILSDTEGVNFNPYLKRIMREIYDTWIPLIPEEARPPLNKSGETLIRFSILPDGNIGGITIEGSTHDVALDRAAYGSITGVNQFPPLPTQFHGPNLELRIHYLVNKNPQAQ